MASDITLTLRIGKVAADIVPRDVIQALTSVEIRTGGEGRGGFDLTFAVSRRSRIVVDLLPSGYFDPPTRVIISVTLAGQETVLMDGVIAQVEMVPADEPGQSVLSVKGEDLTRMLDLLDLSGFPWPGMPAEARVALMIAKYVPLYRIVPMVIPSVFIDVPNPLRSIPPQRGTDYTYITLLAARVGYIFRFYPGPDPSMSIAYWGPRVRLPFLPQPEPLAINWDGRSNVESLSFSFDGFKKTLWVIVIQDQSTQFPIPIPVPDVNPLSPPLGAKQPIPLAIRPLVGMAKYTPLQAAAVGLAKAAETADVVSCQGKLDVLRYGAILPLNSTVDVRGGGITFDGTYFVDSVTHSIKRGSYKQSFGLTRNALLPGNNPLSFLTSPAQELAGFAQAGTDAAAGTAGAGAAALRDTLPAPLATGLGSVETALSGAAADVAAVAGLGLAGRVVDLPGSIPRSP